MKTISSYTLELLWEHIKEYGFKETETSGLWDLLQPNHTMCEKCNLSNKLYWYDGDWYYDCSCK